LTNQALKSRDQSIYEHDQKLEKILK